MRRTLLFLTIAAMVMPLIVATPTNDAGAAAPVPNSLLLSNRSVIRGVYDDFLDRPPTRAESRRFETSLGVTLTERDLQAIVLGTRQYYRSAGASTSKYIHAVVRETKGRRATRAEMRELRALYSATEGTKVTARRRVAAKALADAAYDRDGFRANKVTVNRDDAGRIQRISVRVNQAVSIDTARLHVSLRGQMITGTQQVRRNGSVIALVPHDRILSSGQLVVSVVRNGADHNRNDPRPDRAEKKSMLSPVRDEIFPHVRVVAYYGNHQTRLLGVLGETGPEAAAVRVKAAAARFDQPGRPAVGAFEMIATVAQGSAGADGNYSHPSKIEDLQRWIDVAAAEGLYVILDIQPGRSDFFTETIRYRELLLQPNVGLALDPEWRMGPTQRPGQTVGSVTAAELNRVSAWLSDLVVENGLPEKMFIVHQFQSRMVKNRQDLVDRPGLATIIHADGFGGRAIKLETYSIIKVGPPFWNGFKLFIDEDYRMFQPADVLAFDTVPVPDLITYQ